MAFDPKAFLAETSPASSGFDPKAFLAETSALDTPAKAAPAPKSFADFMKDVGKGPPGVGVESPFRQAATGGFLKSVGGALELFPGSVGRFGADVTQAGTALTAPAEKKSAISGYAGDIVGQLAMPLGPAIKGVSAASKALNLGKGTSTVLGFAGGGAAAGALTGTGKEDYTKRLKEKGFDALVGGVLGSVLGAGIVGGAAGIKYLSTALGREATQAEKELVKRAKDLADGKISDLSDEEKRLAQHLRDTLEQKKTASGVLEQVHPEDLVAREQARKAAGLPNPTTGEQIASSQHVEGQLRPLAEANLTKAETIQAEEGGKPFKKYLEVANEKQSSQPFGLSPEGKALEKELDTIIKGGAGDLRNVSSDEAATAQRLKDALYPRAAEKPSNIDPDLAAQLQAAGAFPESQVSRQVDFSLVERELRHLRDLQQKKAIEGFTGVQRAETKGVADRLEEAMKRWVGEENYARPNYAAASKEYNLWKTQFGEKLTGKQEIPYSLEGGVYVTPESQLSQHVFQSKDTVRFAQELMGEARINQLAEQHAADQLKGLKGEAARDWLDNPKNAFIDAVPGLRGKLSSYVQKIEAHEAGGAGLFRMKETAQREYAEFKDQASALSEKIKGISGRSEAIADALEKMNKAKSTALTKDAASELISALKKSKISAEASSEADLLVEKLEKALAKRNKARLVISGYAATAAAGVSFAPWAARRISSGILGD